MIHPLCIIPSAHPNMRLPVSFLMKYWANDMSITCTWLDGKNPTIKSGTQIQYALYVHDSLEPVDQIFPQ